MNNLLRCIDDFTERDTVDAAIDAGDSKQALQLMKDRAENFQKRLLRHIFRLHYLVPRDVAKLCGEIYPFIHPWEAVLMFLSTATNVHNTCSDFLMYITHLLQNHGKKNENKMSVIKDLRCPEKFLIIVYRASLILDDLNDSDIRCQCGLPRPGSHRTSFQYEELMVDVIQVMKSSNDYESLKKLFNISYCHGYWLGCIQILVMLEYRKEAIKLALQLRDISLFNVSQMWGCLPRSFDEWRYGLQYLITIHFRCGIIDEESDFVSDAVYKSALKATDGDRLKFVESNHVGEIEKHVCIKGTTLSSFTDLHGDLKNYLFTMLRLIGPQQALRIVLDTQLQKIFIPEEFYYKCILCFQLQNCMGADLSVN